MTREEARKSAEVMMAYAAGKKIEYSYEEAVDWEDDDDPDFDWSVKVYRIKEESTYRPFKDKNECWVEMQKHQPFGWVMDKKAKNYQSIVILGESDYEHLLQHLVFADGTPFGIKEE